MRMPLTVKGQVTIPKPIRDHLGVALGSRVAFSIEEDGRVLLSRAEPDQPVADRFGDLAARAPAGWNGMTTNGIMRLTRGEDWGDAG